MGPDILLVSTAGLATVTLTDFGCPSLERQFGLECNHVGFGTSFVSYFEKR